MFDDIHEEACGRFVRLPNSLSLYLKLENCQATGSFKIRGVAAQLDAAQRILSKGGQRDIKDLKLITMSAGIIVKCFISCTSRDISNKKVIDNHSLNLEKQLYDCAY